MSKAKSSKTSIENTDILEQKIDQNIDTQSIDLNENLTNKIKSLEDKNLRLSAEIQNLHRQHELEQLQYLKKGKRIVTMNIVSFLSTLNIAFTYLPETADEKVLSFIGTLKNSYEKLQEELNKCGVELIIPNIGDVFDSSTMNSLTPAINDDHIVKNIASIGMRVDGQVVQPASVIL